MTMQCIIMWSWISHLLYDHIWMKALPILSQTSINFTLTKSNTIVIPLNKQSLTKAGSGWVGMEVGGGYLHAVEAVFNLIYAHSRERKYAHVHANSVFKGPLQPL